jgi:anti-sigma factor RsiW
VTGRCLGARVADLADGRLSPAETERAYAHVATCPACAVALEAQRAASSSLGGTAIPAPSSDFLTRLGAIPAQESPLVEPTPVARPTSLIPSQAAAGARRTAPIRPRAGASTAPVPTGPGRPRTRRVVVGAAASAALVVAAYVGVSGATTAAVTTPQPAIGRVVDTFAVEHAISVDRMPLTGPQIQQVDYAGPSGSASPSPAP